MSIRLPEWTSEWQPTPKDSIEHILMCKNILRNCHSHKLTCQKDDDMRNIDGMERNIFAVYMSLEGPLLSHPRSLLWRGMGSINKCGKQ